MSSLVAVLALAVVRMLSCWAGPAEAEGLSDRVAALEAAVASLQATVATLQANVPWP